MPTPDQSWSDPANWWAGIVYRAPADPRLIVPKRTRLGWTLNFARPAAWAMLAAIIALVIAVKIIARP